MSGLVNPEVYRQRSVDDLLREAARRFIDERRDFTGFQLDTLFHRLAADAFEAERSERRTVMPPGIPSGR